MQERLEGLLVTLGWGLVLAAVSLHTLYVEPVLSSMDVLILFLVSLIAGALLKEIETFVVGFVLALGSSVLLMLFCLSLPGIFGVTGEVTSMLYDVAIVTVARSIFPAPFVAILLGGFFGNMLGERLRIR